MLMAGGLWLFCLQCEHFHQHNMPCAGESNMLVQLSDISVAHLSASEADLSEAMHFEPAASGALEFKLIDSDKVLGCVEVKPDDIEAEIMVLDEHKAEVYASIKQGVSSADESHIAQVDSHNQNNQQGFGQGDVGSTGCDRKMVLQDRRQVRHNEGLQISM